VNDLDDDALSGRCATRLRPPAWSHLQLLDGTPLGAGSAVCMVVAAQSSTRASTVCLRFDLPFAPVLLSVVYCGIVYCRRKSRSSTFGSWLDREYWS
jgi:hypothetical protein